MLTVQTIVNIAAQAEKVFDHRYHFDLLMEQSLYAGADNLGASPAGARVVVKEGLVRNGSWEWPMLLLPATMYPVNM